MAKIFVKSQGALVIKNGKKLEPIEFFEASVGDCDCAIECCGDKQVIRWVTPDKKLRTITLDALFALVPVESKTETQL